MGSIERLNKEYTAEVGREHYLFKECSEGCRHWDDDDGCRNSGGYSVAVLPGVALVNCPFLGDSDKLFGKTFK